MVSSSSLYERFKVDKEEGKKLASERNSNTVAPYPSLFTCAHYVRSAWCAVHTMPGQHGVLCTLSPVSCRARDASAFSVCEMAAGSQTVGCVNLPEYADAFTRFESGPLRAVHRSLHKWPGGLDICAQQLASERNLNTVAPYLPCSEEGSYVRCIDFCITQL